MIESAVAVMEALISLLRSRKGTSGRASAFREQVELLFHDMTLIHTDYLEATEELLGSLTGSSGDDIVQRVRMRRARHAALRGKAQALAAAIEPDAARYPPELVAFAKACSEYFTTFAGGERPGAPGQSAMTLLVRDLESERLGRGGADGDHAKRLAREWLVRVREDLESSWRTLTRTYARARLAMM